MTIYLVARNPQNRQVNLSRSNTIFLIFLHTLESLGRVLLPHSSVMSKCSNSSFNVLFIGSIKTIWPSGSECDRDPGAFRDKKPSYESCHCRACGASRSAVLLVVDILRRVCALLGPCGPGAALHRARPVIIR
jgi:hypothetical protein